MLACGDSHGMKQVRVRQVPLIAPFYSALLALLLGSCGSHDEIRIAVDGQIFAVPREHLLPSRVAWLPQFGEFEGFVFTARPSARLSEQFAVTVEPRGVRCTPDNVASSEILALACRESGAAETSSAVRPLKRELVYPGIESFWTYTVQTSGESRRAPIASCSASASSEASDICLAFGRYSSLIYSFTFKDEDIGSIDERRTEIKSLLSDWEQD